MDGAPILKIESQGSSQLAGRSFRWFFVFIGSAFVFFILWIIAYPSYREFFVMKKAHLAGDRLLKIAGYLDRHSSKEYKLDDLLSNGFDKEEIIDPFTSKQFHLIYPKNNPKEWVLFSAGEDGLYDSYSAGKGIIEENLFLQPKGDIVFTDHSTPNLLDSRPESVEKYREGKWKMEKTDFWKWARID